MSDVRFVAPKARQYSSPGPCWRSTALKWGDIGFDTHSLFPLKVTDFEVVNMGTPIPLTDNCRRNP